MIIALFLAIPAGAATYTALSCSWSDVVTAIAIEQASKADGDIIAIPACPSGVVWSGISQISQSFTNSVTIQGAGAVSATTGGSSTTGTDQTVITDAESGNSALFSLTSVSGKSLRWTGIAVIQNSSAGPKQNGSLAIHGNSSAVRIDHCHFYSYASGNKPIAVWDSTLGVADHNYFDALPGIVTNDIAFLNGGTWQGASDGLGDKSWADTDHFGTSQFFFAEDSLFNRGWVADCSNGGRFVIRYSTTTTVYGTEEHGTHDPGRGCRAAEFYQNTNSTADPSVSQGPILSLNSGAALVWGNTTTQYYYLAQVSIVRQNNGTYTQLAPPNGWGYCGNAQTGSTSTWDGNNTTNGYPCLDAPGRGAGDLLTGASFPSIANSILGGQTWPREALDPIYLWDNSFDCQTNCSGSSAIVNNSTSGNLVNNRDFYMQFSTYGNPGSFNGTAGVGQGLFSAKPGTCTAGVGYWATDQNTLYVCNPTNTWTTYYQPYTYPYPSTPSVATPFISPVSGAYTSPQTVSITDGTAGATICWTNDNSTPTANGAGTCTHGTTYSGSFPQSIAATVKAIGSKSGFTDSSVAANVYTLVQSTKIGILMIR